MSPALHSWDISPEQAVQVQAELRRQLILVWDGRPITTVGGVDVGLHGDLAQAAIVVLDYPTLNPLEAVTAERQLVFPYIPGLLAFREGPAVLAAWEKLSIKPDVVLFDGQGIAHPRGLGIASQMGLWLERPTIGVAKSRLYGRYQDPGPQRGDYSWLYDERDEKRVIGAVLRTRLNTNPLFISPGHLIDLEHAMTIVIECCLQYRLPEPTRWAHRVAGGEKLPSSPIRQGRLF